MMMRYPCFYNVIRYLTSSLVIGTFAINSLLAQIVGENILGISTLQICWS